MSSDVWQIASFTVVMALVATMVMLPIGVALAWVLAHGRFAGRTIVETAVSLPLVMPPVATGLILLKLFARRGPVGRVLEAAGIDPETRSQGRSLLALMGRREAPSISDHPMFFTELP